MRDALKGEIVYRDFHGRGCYILMHRVRQDPHLGQTLKPSLARLLEINISEHYRGLIRTEIVR